jgi:Lar family restriction alleviation protein
MVWSNTKAMIGRTSYTATAPLNNFTDVPKNPDPFDAWFTGVTELAACPFCGSTREVSGSAGNFNTDPPTEFFFIECASCGACGGHSNDKVEAVRLWNQRRTEPLPVIHD